MRNKGVVVHRFSPPSSQSSQPPHCCVIIDPSLVIRTVLTVELRRLGYPSCATFATPFEALQAISLQQIPIPDIALFCWRLPKIDGLEVLKYLKRSHYHTASILLLDQDQDSPMSRVKARLAGAQNTLVKPFTIQELHACLASLLYQN